MLIKETKLSNMDGLSSNSKPIMRELSYNSFRMKFLYQKINFVVNTIFYSKFSDRIHHLYELKRDNLMKGNLNILI